MHLDLVDRRHDRRLREQALEMIGHEIAHADCAHLAVGEQPFQSAVRVEREIEPAGHRLMQEQEIDPIDTKLAGALGERVS